jgi:hypothetical protein
MHEKVEAAARAAAFLIGSRKEHAGKWALGGPVARVGNRMLFELTERLGGEEVRTWWAYAVYRPREDRHVNFRVFLADVYALGAALKKCRLDGHGTAGAALRVFKGMHQDNVRLRGRWTLNGPMNADCVVQYFEVCHPQAGLWIGRHDAAAPRGKQFGVLNAEYFRLNDLIRNERKGGSA